MRWDGTYLLAAAIAIAPLFSAMPALAQQSNQDKKSGGFEVQASCPAGSHWVDAPGYRRGGKYREGHCERD